MNHFWCAILVLLIIGVLITAAPQSDTHHKVCWHCNVVIIAIDLLRYDALPCHGYHLPTAPNICKFAEHNSTFTNAYVPSSWTLPVVASMFTGLYPTSHNIIAPMRSVLNPKLTTLPMILQKDGYKTIVVSNVQPNVGLELGLGKGFDIVRLTKKSTSDSLRQLHEALQDLSSANARHQPGFIFYHTDTVRDYMDTLPRLPTAFPLDPAYVPPLIPLNVYRFTEKTRTVMRDHLLFIVNVDTIRNKDGTFTRLLAALNATQTLAEAKKIYDQLPTSEQDDIIWESGKDTIQQSLGGEYSNVVRHLYDNTIHDIDQGMKGVFTQLANSALNRRTIIIVTSEHGEFLGERGLYGHYMPFYTEEIHVPLIMRIPNIAPLKINALVSLMDLYPTILDLAAVHAPRPTSSISLAPLLTHIPNPPTRKFVISEWYQSRQDKNIRTAEWNLMQKSSDQGITYELYNLITDPQEKVNVADSNQAVVASLSRLLYQTLSTQPVYPNTTKLFPDWIDEKHRENLIKTGYF